MIMIDNTNEFYFVVGFFGVCIHYIVWVDAAIFNRPAKEEYKAFNDKKKIRMKTVKMFCSSVK